jgi:hypothetical protein
MLLLKIGFEISELSQDLAFLEWKKLLRRFFPELTVRDPVHLNPTSLWQGWGVCEQLKNRR